MIKFDANREFDALGIGEVMLRLSPSGKERISYSETFEKKAGGSELNVVSGISMLDKLVHLSNAFLPILSS